MSSYFNYNAFLSEFSSLQQKMLFMEQEYSKHGFNILYDRASDYFSQLYEQNKNFHKGDKNYFIKKQAELILKYLHELDQKNKNLEMASEHDIIQLFEKQYKLKKIILRLMGHWKKI
jgi:DNA repair photolyase